MSRRRRIWRATISLFCLPLMLIGADKVYALEHDAALYRAMQGVAVCAPRSCEGAAVCYAYTWDANGNMLTREFAEGDENSRKDTYQYDYENHLIHVGREIGLSGSGVKADYRYDPDGIRRMKTTGTTVTTITHYLVDRNRPYAQVLVESSVVPNVANSGVVTTYVYGDDLISRARTADEEFDDGSGGTYYAPVTHRRYYHYDGQLSTRYLTDEGAGATPQVTDEYTYDAFGVMLHKEGLTAAGESDNTYLYTGEQYDALAGMYYLRARYYAQQQGRFVTMDPFGGYDDDPKSLHKYLYANANPVTFVDPSGQDAVLAARLVHVGILALLAALIVLPLVAAVFPLTGAGTGVDLTDILGESRDYLNSVFLPLIMLGFLMLSSIYKLAKAIKDSIQAAAKALGRAAKQIANLPRFYVFKSLWPDIYKLHVKTLARNPKWYVLKYDPIVFRHAPRRRAATAPCKPNKAAALKAGTPKFPQIDEFPYASTFQGGRGAGCAVVSGFQNASHGGTLGVFYVFRLKLRARQFLVVPVPI